MYSWNFIVCVTSIPNFAVLRYISNQIIFVNKINRTLCVWKSRKEYLCRLFFFYIICRLYSKIDSLVSSVDCVYWQKVNISTYWISSRSLENYILSFDGFFMWHEVVSFIRIADKRLQKDLHYYCLPPFINLWLIECTIFSFNPWNILNYLLNYKNPILRRLESVYNQYGKL